MRRNPEIELSSNGGMTFAWKPLYMELAEKLRGYRGRQAELLSFLSVLKANIFASTGRKLRHYPENTQVCSAKMTRHPCRPEIRRQSGPIQ
jgi:hypothetical protein